MSVARWTVATVAVTLGFAAVADADTKLTGSTAEGVRVKLVAESGNATFFTISSQDVTCKHGRLATGKITFGPFDRSDPGSFSDKSKDRSRHRALFKSKTKLTGSIKHAGTGWRGTYARTTKVVKHHDVRDICRVRTTWTAG